MVMLTKKELLKFESDDTKYCSVCRKIKPLCEFGLDPDKRKFAQSACLMCEKDRWYRRMYGITSKDYDKLLKKQNGKCAICGTINPGGKCDNFSVDHNHKTGKVKGLLCIGCNRGLGFFNDDPKKTVAATTYLIQNTKE